MMVIDSISKTVNADRMAARGYERFVRAFLLVTLVAQLRFLAKGWIGSWYVDPSHHLAYPGWPHVPVMTLTQFYVLWAVMLAGLVMAWKPSLRKVGIGLFLPGFIYCEAIDAAYYLNHHVLVILVFLQIWVLPRAEAGTVPRYAYGLLRWQLSAVYFGAAMAKMQGDWLLRGEPLASWLQFFIPLHSVGFIVVSWGAMMFDLIMPWLLWRRQTVNYAIFSVWVFHLLTALWFNIGMFPWFMMAGSLIFLQEGELPVAPRLQSRAVIGVNGWGRRGYLLVAAASVIHGFMLLHPWWQSRDVMWTDRGLWLSWRVMVAEKTGSVRFLLQDRVTGGKEWKEPAEMLTRWQEQQMAGQADLILGFAHDLALEQEKISGHSHSVFAESQLAMNGKSARPYVRADVDLSKISRSDALDAWIY